MSSDDTQIYRIEGGVITTTLMGVKLLEGPHTRQYVEYLRRSVHLYV